MKAPSFLCLPERVRGIPIFLDIRALKADIPINLLQENPPLFMLFLTSVIRLKFLIFVQICLA